MVEHRSPVHFREMALLQGASMGHLDRAIMDRLRSKQDNVNARHPHTGASALHLAVQYRGDGTNVLEFLLQQGADVNAQDNQNRTPLHEAVRRGRADIVLLLLRHRANPNLMDSKRCIPRDELSARNLDDAKQIVADLRRYGSFPRKKFYEGLFTAPKNRNDIDAWFERLVRSIRDVYQCKIFFSITTAGMVLRLLEPPRVEELIPEALFEAMKYCKTVQSRRVLLQLNDYAERESLAPSSVTDLVNDFLQGREFRNTTDDNFFASVKVGCVNVNGVDGRSYSIKNSLVYYRQEYDKLKHWPQRNPEIDPYNRRGDDKIDMTRMQALICIVGAVVNALHREQTADREMENLVGRVVDFFDKEHLMGINGQSGDNVRNGLTSGGNFIKDPKRQVDSRDLGNGPRMIGFCAGVLHQMDDQNDNTGTASLDSRSKTSISRKSLSSRASMSTRSSVKSFRSISTNASLIFRDAFLSPEDDKDGKLPLHRAIVHRDIAGLSSALEDETVDLNEMDSEGRSALDLAALTGQEDFFRMLEGRGAKSLIFDSIEALRYMLHTRAPNKEDYFGYVKYRNTSGSDSSDAADDRSLVSGERG